MARWLEPPFWWLVLAVTVGILVVWVIVLTTNANGLVIGEVILAAEAALPMTKAIVPKTSANFPIIGEDIQPLFGG